MADDAPLPPGERDQDSLGRGPLGLAATERGQWRGRLGPLAAVVAVLGALGAGSLWWFIAGRGATRTDALRLRSPNLSWKPAAQWADPNAGLPGFTSARERLDSALKTVGQLTAELNSPALMREIASDGRPWGDLRQPAAAGSPPWQRWEIRLLEGHTLETYSRQLDFFAIELGVLLPEGKVLYVFNLSQAKPDTRLGDVRDETRCYLTWQSGRLGEADEELLTRAGVDGAGRVVLKFLPPAVERKLAELERAEAGSALDRVEKTCFGVRAAEGGYEFFVYEQLRRR